MASSVVFDQGDPFGLGLIEEWGSLPKILRAAAEENSLFQPLHPEIESLALKELDFVVDGYSIDLELPALATFEDDPLPELDLIPALSTASSSEFGHCGSLDEIGIDLWQLGYDEDTLESFKGYARDEYSQIEEQAPNPAFATELELNIDRLVQYNKSADLSVGSGLSSSCYSPLFFALNCDKRAFSGLRKDTADIRGDRRSYGLPQSLRDNILEVREFTDESETRKLFTVNEDSIVATIANTATTILTAIEEHCVQTAYNGAGEPSVHMVCARISVLTTAVLELLRSCVNASSNSDVVERAFGNLPWREGVDLPLQLILIQMSIRLSGPWLEDLEECIGLRTDSQFHLTKDEQTKKMTPDHKRSSLLNTPQFLSERLKTRLKGCADAFAYVRTHMPDNPMCRSTSMYNTPRLEWALTQNLAECASDTANNYERTLQDLLGKHEFVQLKERDLFSEITDNLELQKSRHDQADPLLTSSPSNESLKSANALLSVHDPLHEAVLKYLNHDTSVLSVNPLGRLPELSFGALLDVQHAALERVVMFSQFNQFSLRTHLDAHYAFHLCSSGAFMYHLAGAIFNPDVSPKSLDQTFQANTDVRLMLAHVCESSWYESKPRSWTLPDLPGNLSLGLPTMVSTIWKNPSIVPYLRLTYTAPESLLSIFTTTAENTYTSIFRQLIRVHYSLCALQAYFRSDTIGGGARDSVQSHAISAFSFHAQSVLTTILGHFHDIGIEPFWNSFMEHVKEVEKYVKSNGQVLRRDRCSRLSIIQEHELALDRIASALLLEESQRKASEALRRVCESVLDFVGRVQEKNHGVVEMYSTWKNMVADFVTECGKLVEQERLSKERRQSGGMICLDLLVQALEVRTNLGERLVTDEELDANDWFDE